MKLLPPAYATRNLWRAPRRSLAALLGSTIVVLLAVGAAAFVRGMNRTLHVEPTHENVLLMGAGSEESVERSELGAGVPGVIAASVPGIRSRMGVAYVSPECHMALVVRVDRDATKDLQASFRGITPAAFLVHAGVQIVEGRAPRPGADELLAGSLAAARLGLPADALAVGQALWFEGRPWTVVGRFVAPGTVMDAELWTPLADLMLATRRSTISCVTITLADEGEFADVDAFVKQRLDLELVAMRESDYYARLRDFYAPIRTLVWMTALLAGLGGLFGGLNTMYAAFAARVRELGTLQTLGYSRVAILFSLVQEALIVTTLGALLAVGAAVLLLDGIAVRISMGAFGLVVDAGVVLIGLCAGLMLGLIGGLPPAWRCLSMPIPAALRSG